MNLIEHIGDNQGRAMVALILLIAAAMLMIDAETETSIVQQEKEGEGQTLDAAATYNITSSGVSPYNQDVGSGESVKFRNERSETISIDGDRWDEKMWIEPGDEEVAEAERITYFEVLTDGEVVGRGRVNAR